LAAESFVHRGAIEIVGLADRHRDEVAAEDCVCGRTATDLGLRAVPSVYAIAPGWWVVGRRRSVREHGSAAGVSALAAARTVGGSVILGDTGRLGIGRFMKQRADVMETLGRGRATRSAGSLSSPLATDGQVHAECRIF